jgi:hypothetical protein
MQFHYFNPNGLYAAKKRVDEQISKLVDQGKCQSGAIFAYGSLNRYAADKIADLAMKKKVGRIESMVAIEMMMDAISSAEKFIGGIMEETRKAALLNPKAAEKETPEAVKRIAGEILGLETLETRNSDSLDFHELAVWNIEDALIAAYEAGLKADAEAVGNRDGKTYTLHVTAGPAYLKEDGWENLTNLVDYAMTEHSTGELGFLQEDRSYKNYLVDGMYIMEDGSDSEDPIWSWYPEKVEEPVKAVTPLQLAMLEKIAFDEFTAANGSMPENHRDTETWADQIIETSQDKGVFTSLLNAELVWHSGTGREAGVGLTEEGYKVFRATTKKN